VIHSFRKSQIIIKDSNNTQLIRIVNARRKGIPIWITNNPGTVSYVTVFSTRYARGRKGFRLRYFFIDHFQDQGKYINEAPFSLGTSFRLDAWGEQYRLCFFCPYEISRNYLIRKKQVINLH
jgi:hypothetical protein